MRLRARARHRLGAGALVLACLATGIACTQTGPVLGTGVDAIPPAASGGGVAGFDLDVRGTPGATTAVVPYGPYDVPAATGTAHGQEAMLQQIKAAVRRPCTNCYVTGMRVDLTYADGRRADLDTGQQLHHAVLLSWPQADPACTAQGLGLLGERFFASGNERTSVRFPAGYGYKVGAIDSWTLMFDLMNTTMAPTRLVIRASFDWVPVTTPGMQAVRPVWLDASNDCVLSGLPPRTGSYSYSTDWTVNRPGKVIAAGAHLHDGGTHLTVTNASTGRLLCNAVPAYAPVAGGPGAEHGADHADEHGGDSGAGGGHGEEHISATSTCLAIDAQHPVGVLTTGQRVRTTAYYDTGLHPLEGNHQIMGIALLYVAP
jgi:hypothetical protein